MTDYVRLLGLAAGAFTTASLVPQLIKSLKSKSTRDISLIMFICTGTGTLLWFIYGLMRKDIPVICANTVTFVFAAWIIALKLKYK
jgi:MtN3 and saliva related transmembrane protein